MAVISPVSLFQIPAVRCIAPDPEALTPLGGAHPDDELRTGGASTSASDITAADIVDIGIGDNWDEVHWHHTRALLIG